ncbi:MAG: hypothetical protein QNJ31_06755 [Candidatus Caenarcaniphilales bacterium]|nr:hypothetical protein [Candidatus Caenarcaniphilales bacterium]
MNEFVLLALLVLGIIMSILLFFDFDERLAKKEENTIGKLIVIEGIEGSGKSELIQLMKETMPIEWAYTKEPYYVVDGIENWTKENFQIDRENHVQNKILPMLKQNRVLVTNRYWMSGCVYDGWDAESYLNIWPEPDLVIWLDCEPNEEIAESTRVPVSILKEMKQGYENLFASLQKDYHLPVKRINSTELNSEDVLLEALPELRKILKFQEPDLDHHHTVESGSEEQSNVHHHAVIHPGHGLAA